MLVRMRTNVAGPNLNCLAGKLAEVRDATGKVLIESNHAAKVDGTPKLKSGKPESVYAVEHSNK